jgi:hypothetical protein
MELGSPSADRCTGSVKSVRSRSSARPGCGKTLPVDTLYAAEISKAPPIHPETMPRQALSDRAGESFRTTCRQDRTMLPAVRWRRTSLEHGRLP